MIQTTPASAFGAELQMSYSATGAPAFDPRELQMLSSFLLFMHVRTDLSARGLQKGPKRKQLIGMHNSVAHKIDAKE